jgi:ABC-type sugar transport system ATPase subunit
VIFVSHPHGEVLEFCDRVTVLRDGAVVGTRNVADLRRDELVEMMLGEPKDEGDAGSSEQHSGERRLRIEGLRVTRRVESFDLDVARGQIVGLAGQVGSGASEVLRAIAGLEPDAAGRVVVDGRRVPLAAPGAAADAGIQFVSNDRKGEGLFLDQPIGRNLTVTRLKEMSRLGVLKRRRLRREARALAGLVGIDVRRLPESVNVLSGGNQQKVLVGRCFAGERLKVLLLDDPTRGVDVGGRAEIHKLVRHLSASGATILFASSELDEILELADVVVTVFAGRIVSKRQRGDATAANVLRDMTHRPESRAHGASVGAG